MRLSRDKVNKVAHTATDALATIDEVDFVARGRRCSCVATGHNLPANSSRIPTRIASPSPVFLTAEV